MRTLFLALAAIALAAPAAAQDGSEASGARTPANAQRFLEVAASRFGLQLEPTSGLTSGRFKGDKLRYGNLRITADGPCRTRFEGTISEFWVKDDSLNSFIANGANTDAATINQLGESLKRSWLKAAPYVIDWSTVTKVGVATIYDPEKGTHDVPEGAYARSPAQSITLVSASDEIGPRLVLAMDTLRQACDSTKELGF